MRAIALSVTLALLLGVPEALAFCRSTTCTGTCPRDDNGCKTTGVPLHWPGLCVGFSLQRDGTVNLPIAAVRTVIENAFVTWSDLVCDEGTASIAFSQLAEVSCHRSEYNTDGPNANVILFQDTMWRYKGEDDTVAKTTVTFDAETGDILDADLEMNFAYNELTVTDDPVVYDLQSILTHEIGHFIGIDHTADFDATMHANYEEGSTAIRTLEADDVAAACAVYPPNRGGECRPAPRGGLGDLCGGDSTSGTGGGDGGGCTLASSAQPSSLSTFGWLSVGAAFLTLARRRKRYS